MCGIAGFYGLRNDDLIKGMSSDLVHRGPDDEGFYIDDATSLLCRRLAIIGREDGKQPIYNEDKSIVVVYNGEIYNYQELREELENKGHIFTTHTDTEVIVHAYEQWGKACFDMFNGMFGIALYEKNTRQLILARDHFGIKPLYYAQLTGGQIIFASEIKPIIYSGLLTKKPNERVLYRYLSFRVHDDQEETFFEGVHKLMPGQMMIITTQGTRKEYFSTLKQDLQAMPEKPLRQGDIEAFRTKLIEAITMRLVSEVPVGTCLSGGLDSSTVVAVVNNLLGKKAEAAVAVGVCQNTFSAVFPGSSNNEERYIDEFISKHPTIEPWKIYPKAEEFFQELADFVRTQEEPVTSSGPYAQYKVMQEAAQHVTVLLDGQGADEMMAGYLPYYFVYLRQLLRQKQYLKLLIESFVSRDVISKFLWDKFLKTIKVRKGLSIQPLLKLGFRQRFAQESFPIVSDTIKKRLIEDIFHNSLPSLLRYEDKNSMRFSLEGRVPFLDFNLVRSLFALSDEAIIDKGWNKSILRRALHDLLPGMIVKRRNKIGFTSPEREWFLRMKNEIFNIFLSESFANRSYFQRQRVLEAFQQFSEGRSDETMLFWRILNVEMWLRIFIDEQPAKPQLEYSEGSFMQANLGKALEIQLDSGIYTRIPIRTDIVHKGDDIVQKVCMPVLHFFQELRQRKVAGREEKRYGDMSWFLVISEKVVAIAQGRSYFISDIKPSFWAKKLSKYVTRTSAGIGLGSPWTMELAIQEVGLPRILLASVVAALTKPFGARGLFYHIVGWKAASIDGPTEYSLYPSNVSAKLGPRDPDKVARQVRDYLERELPEEYTKHFRGVAIIDANDLGRNLLGNATPLKASEIEQAFKDNPMGQGSEQTPVTVVFCHNPAVPIAQGLAGLLTLGSTTIRNS